MEKDAVGRPINASEVDIRSNRRLSKACNEEVVLAGDSSKDQRLRGSGLIFDKRK
jgi:hypothetical protein